VLNILQKAAGIFLFETKHIPKSTSQESSSSTAMEIDGAESEKPVETLNTELFADIAKYYKEVYDIFGEAIDSYVAPYRPVADSFV
jgi:hypothetical protein